MERESQITNIVEANRANMISSLERALQTPEEIRLRDHQVNMFADTLEFLKSEKRSGFIAAAGASGKSAVMVKLAEILGVKTIMVSPTVSIMLKNQREAEKWAPGLKVSNVYADERDFSGQVINTTYQSLGNMIDAITQGKKVFDSNGIEFNPDQFGLFLGDETHLGLGPVRHQIYRGLKNAFFIGLTATPYFGALRGLRKTGRVTDEDEWWTGLFTNLIHELSLEESLERGISPEIDIRILKTGIKVGSIQADTTGDYSDKDLEKYFTSEARNGLILGLIAGVDQMPDWLHLPPVLLSEINQIHQEIAGKKTGIFGVSINNIETLAANARGAGLRTEAVHGKKQKQFEPNIKDFNEGDLQILTGVDALATGVDTVPMEVVILGRPTASSVRVTQELARGMRQSPETGKEKLIAIQLADIVSGGVQPVLIPQLFSKDYILQGSSTGIETKGTATHREKPKITITGMEVGAIFERAKASELIQTRFEAATAQEMSEYLHKVLAEARELNPNLGSHDLLSGVNDQLPGRVSLTAQQSAIEAIKNNDPAGKDALLLLNLKTVLLVVDHYLNPGIDAEDFKDELMQVGVEAIYEFEPEASNSEYPITVRLNSLVDSAIARHLSRLEDIPGDVSRANNKSVLMAELALDGISSLTNNERSELLDDLVTRFGGKNKWVLRGPLERYLQVLNQVEVKEISSASDALEEDVEQSILEDDLDKALIRYLTPREANVLRLRYGLGYERFRGPSTFSEVAETLERSIEHMRQIASDGMRKLRTSPEFVITFFDDEILLKETYKEYIEVQKEAIAATEEKESEDITQLDVFVPDGKADWLVQQLGMRQVGDVFINLPDQRELMTWTAEDRRNLQDGLQWTAVYLSHLKDSSSNFIPLMTHDRTLLNHATDSILNEIIQQDKWDSSLSFLSDQEKDLLKKELNLKSGEPIKLSPEELNFVQKSVGELLVSGGVSLSQKVDVYFRKIRQKVFILAYRQLGDYRFNLRQIIDSK